LTSAPPAPEPTEIARVQRRTLTVLFLTQVLGGVGFAIGVSVGALLAADMVGVAVSGLALSAAVVGGALLAVPATWIVRRSGRRLSLATAYLVSSAGGMLVVSAALTDSVALLFCGFFLFGGGSTAGMQSRYAAVDLAPEALRGRHLSLIVWATTLGAVTGPNLAPAAGAALSPYGVPVLAAPFAFSVVLLGAAAGVLLLLLKPDPAQLARRTANRARDTSRAGGRAEGIRAAARAVRERPEARLGIAATAVAHLVMVGVMAMTPVHVMGAGHEPAQTLRIVGVIQSLHIAGMYAFAPLSGWATDRFGRRPVILAGVALLVLACAVAGSAGHESPQLAAGLVLLGLGWSASVVAGSTLLTESIPVELRPSTQGLSDLTMGLAGASAGALSGVVVGWAGYATLALLAGLATLPLAAATLRTANRRVPASASG
jgi:MFS family permease